MQAKIALEINQEYIGNVEEVMVEDTNVTHGRRQWKGRNRSNKWVFFPEPDTGASDAMRAFQAGQLMQVRIEHTTAWSLQGCAVKV